MLDSWVGSRPRTLYKYRSLDSVVEQNKVKDILLNNRLYFSTRLGFNDPFDCRIPVLWDRSTRDDWRAKLLETYGLKGRPAKWKGTVEQYVEWLLQEKDIIAKMKKSGPRAINSLLDTHGVLCLCRHPDEILMWSHYANNHEGVCLQFRVLKGSLFSDAVPVEYAEYYPVLKATLPQKELADGMIRTKASHWKHEAEWRVFKRDAPALHNFPQECLCGVILGCRILPKNEALITSWLLQRASSVTLYKAVQAKDKFALTIQRIKDIGP
jgi:hypothetical protein